LHFEGLLIGLEFDISVVGLDRWGIDLSFGNGRDGKGRGFGGDIYKKFLFTV